MTDNGEEPTLITDDELTDIEDTNTVEKNRGRRPPITPLPTSSGIDKKPYKMTDARKKALEKGRQSRSSKIAENKIIKDVEKEKTKISNQRNKALKLLGISEESLAVKKLDNELVKSRGLHPPTTPYATSSAIDKVKKPTKKQVVYEDESSSEDEPPTVEKKKKQEPMKKIEEVIKPFRLKRV